MNRSIILASILLLQSVCFLAASGQFINVLLAGEPAKVASPGPTKFGETRSAEFGVLTGNLTSFKLIAEHIGPDQVCYLEVVSGYDVNRVYHWTKPCPADAPLRVSRDGFWCRFEFAADGNLVLKSGATNVPAENGTVLWSSNTSGSGATNLWLVDSDAAFGPGNLVLYNGFNEVVWSAFGNTSDYGCTYLNYTAHSSSTLQVANFFNIKWIILIWWAINSLR